MYVWIVYDNMLKMVLSIFRSREDAEKYAKEYCTDYKLIFEVIN